MRRSKTSSPADPSSSASASSYSTWLLLDADDHALPFLRTFHHPSSKPNELASGSSSPAATSSEKLTETTNIPSSRVASLGSNVRSQASKYENDVAANGSDKEKERRMSLQHQAGNAGSTGKKGFMSRLRAAGGSVSSAHVFNAPPSSANAMSTSGSWSLVDGPAPIKEQSTAATSSARAVHLAFTTLANEAATRHAEGLVSRASSLLLPISMQESKESTEQFHPNRLDAASLTSLVAATSSEAIYVGSARPASASETLPSYLKELFNSSAGSSLKLVLLEPAAVRQLTPAQASSLHDMARSHSLTLLLPIRWNTLWTASIEETLLGLEILHDLADEQEDAIAANGDAADVSLDKSFDVSMSIIPTGLSGDGLDKVAELEAVKMQLEQVKRELGNRDKRIADLSKQVEEQHKQAKQQGAAAEGPGSGLASTRAVVVEPKTPVRSPVPVAAADTAVTPAAPTQPIEAVPAATSRTPGPTIKATPASDTAASICTPSTSMPIPSTSPHLAAATSSPAPSSSTSTSTGGPTLAPAAPIFSPQRHDPSSESPTSSPAARSSGKVIAALTAELAETKSLLEATRSALSTVKSQSAAFQAQADEMRATLSRARLENDSSVTILSRKDRQISEALERARKAEAEARELGRASREWGTRIREVEEELGKERIKRSRAEQAYELVGAEWKTARGRLVDEVRQLKEEHKKAVDGLADEYQKVLVFKQRLQDESSLLSTDDTHPDETLIPPTKLVSELKQLHAQMETHLQAQLQPLLKQLHAFEARENRDVVDRLQLLTDELTRIKTLMRRGDVVSASQVPAGPF
ncbi:hypothetical protein EX895_003295 [Sporisorium graminicola]|uniref:SWI5-dependent HO expression protein 3 n=1 Tax=Sporisorium graminicola TaxID=280036 RepID=A0A4U7KT55_9BASI|nr:hypothetical protein EX895_003295 [Sporisorium graminicola]TKY87714.1 hypothetical protein EX895_003295 [Sporisorium graminicola]